MQCNNCKLCSGFDKWTYLLFKKPISSFLYCSLLVDKDEMQKLINKINNVTPLSNKDAMMIIYIIRDHYKEKTNKLLRGGVK